MGDARGADLSPPTGCTHDGTGQGKKARPASIAEGEEGGQRVSGVKGDTVAARDSNKFRGSGKKGADCSQGG